MYIFFFMQKTAYDMRISDWSSDVCSSDLFRRSVTHIFFPAETGMVLRKLQHQPVARHLGGDGRRGNRQHAPVTFDDGAGRTVEFRNAAIGRATGRARGWQVVEISVVAVELKK